MPNLTTNFSWNLPKVNNAEDEDLWGTQLNANWTSIDGQLIRDTSTETAANFNVSATADFNKQYLIDTTSNVVQADLPALAGVVDGYTVHFKVIDTTNVFTIDASGAELINGSTTYVTATGVTLVADQTGVVWRTVGDITDPAQIPAATTTVAGIQEVATDTEAKTMTAVDKFVVPGNLGAMNATVAECAAGIISNEFMSPANFAGTKSLGASGYYTIPGGLTIQWGVTGAVGAGGTVVVTYPLAYTTAYSAVITGVNGSVNDNPHINAAIGNTNFTIRAGGSGANSVYWISVGLV
jgi:hypothetical protein